jgi:hypothetical protein
MSKHQFLRNAKLRGSFAIFVGRASSLVGTQPARKEPYLTMN